MRGFLSIALVIAALLLFGKDLMIYEETYSGAQEIKNAIALNQRINDVTYDLEYGFREAVHESLESVPVKELLKMMFDKKEAVEQAVTLEACSQIEKWFKNYPNYSMEAGYVDPNDYRMIERGSCGDFLGIDLDSMTARIEEKNIGASILPGRIAFVFRGEEGANFTVLIPEGTEIS